MRMNIPKDLIYSKTHEWVKTQNDGSAIIGITDFAQQSLGDIVFVDYKVAVGDTVSKESPIIDLESVKAVESVYSPVSAEIKELNSKLEADYSMMNKSCYEQGWLVKIKILNPNELTSLMKADEYMEYCEQESHKH
jgi:glycine cleavage system H protein